MRACAACSERPYSVSSNRGSRADKSGARFALVVGDGGLVAHATGPDDEGLPPEVSQEQFDRWVACMQPIEPIHFVGHAAPAHLLFQNGRTDELVPEADGLAYQTAGSEPKTCLWYPDGHGYTPERLRDQAQWFAERIGPLAAAAAR